jgi:hypothetical protein
MKVFSQEVCPRVLAQYDRGTDIGLGMPLNDQAELNPP